MKFLGWRKNTTFRGCSTVIDQVSSAAAGGSPLERKVRRTLIVYANMNSGTPVGAWILPLGPSVSQ